MIWVSELTQTLSHMIQKVRIAFDISRNSNLNHSSMLVQSYGPTTCGLLGRSLDLVANLS